MARHLFGLSPADFAMQKIGLQLQLVPGAAGTVWDSLTGGTQLTDLTDVNSAPITTVLADDNAQVGFFGPDSVSSLYVDFGFGARFLMVATDLGDWVTALQDTKADVSGATFTGPVVLPGNPSTNFEASPKEYVDNSATSAAIGAVSAHTAAVDPHGDQAYANSHFLSLSGGTLSGPLTLSGPPASALHAATKAYVDSAVPVTSVNTKTGAVVLGASDIGALSASGGTISGNLTVSGNLSVTGVGRTLFARKTSDQSVTSSTTLANDSQLLLPTVASATYTLFLMCIFSGGTTGDIKFDWTVPSGTVLRWSDQTGASGLNSDVDVYSAPGGSTQVAFQIWATVVTSSTAGNVQFRWAQNTSDTTATIVRTNSYLQLTRVA